MANKRDRQNTIREIIASKAVGSQEELRRLLVQRGWDVTQSTLSRDLRELRLVRMPTPGGEVRYAEAASGGTEDSSPALEALLPALFTNVDGVGELAVLHTLVGGAQPLAVALDAEEWPELLGTIAGDDTILLICRSASAREKAIRKLRAMAEERG
ncbi:MAG: arginine repressor [Gemmatimonadaceae bacterium]